MCMTTEMLAVFLNLLDPTIVATSPGAVTIKAAEGAAVWTVSAWDLWCTDAPVRDMDVRFETTE